MFDLCVIGGGASGMAAALSAAAAAPGLRIGVLEKNDEPGKKLAVTGNGRCNLSNRAAEGQEPVKAFFDAVGLAVREEPDGWRYPYCGRGTVVREALAREMARRRVSVICGAEIGAVEVPGPDEGGGFSLKTDSGGLYFARKVILAAGGKAGPAWGTTGDGCRIAKALGHEIRPLYPVLTPLRCGESAGAEWRELKGLRVRGRVSLLKKREELAREEGEVQFTAEGVSGICVFNLSRFLRIDRAEPEGRSFSDYRIRLDLMPEYSEEEVAELLLRRSRTLETAETPALLHSLAAPSLAGWIGRAGPFGSLPELAARIKGLTFTVTGAGGWREAQCTGGGVALSERDPVTMESLKVPGLYFAGEVLDYDGPCGGFNLHHAWLSGILAGSAAAGRLKAETASPAGQEACCGKTEGRRSRRPAG